jgi:hypothetical protein
VEILNQDGQINLFPMGTVIPTGKSLKVVCKPLLKINKNGNAQNFTLFFLN